MADIQIGIGTKTIGKKKFLVGSATIGESKIDILLDKGDVERHMKKHKRLF
jgi:hypothetical protein